MDSRVLLQNFVTQTEGHVFALTNLQGMAGAVMARYSRAEQGLRETLLKEFIEEDQLDVKRASELIERVLIAYGDDSVGELEGAHLCFEEISLLATKVIEHRRIGGSPIEQSTRYVRYDYKDPVRGYRYYVPSQLVGTDVETRYRADLDRIFELYSQMWKPLEKWLIARKPLESAEYRLGERGERWTDLCDEKARKAFKRTYKNDIKTKTCDILRAFLPLATRANMGLFGNGRFYQHMLSKMMSSELTEARELAVLAHAELSKVIPHYVKRAQCSEYLVRTIEEFRAALLRNLPDLGADGDTGIQRIEPDYVWMANRLAEWGTNPESLRRLEREQDEIAYLANLAFPYCQVSFSRLQGRLAELPDSARAELIAAYHGKRESRRDRPERGLEHGYPHVFELVTEWAVYKDLMRHRMATIQYQEIGPELGFEMPVELAEAGLSAAAEEAKALSESLFVYLVEKAPQAKAYAMLQGHKLRWMIGINERALMHLLELRTAPQGHPNYRRAAQTIFERFKDSHPERAKQMKFVNHDEIYWSRSDSEAQQRRKESKLGIDSE